MKRPSAHPVRAVLAAPCRDPGLVSLTAPYDLHLKGSSRCMNAGTTNLIAGAWISYPPSGSGLPRTVPLDFEGDLRPGNERTTRIGLARKPG